MQVSFIGLGIMGSRMAANLIKNGVEVLVANRSQTAITNLVNIGAKAATSYTEAVTTADIVFTMLSTPEAVKMVMLEEGVAAMKKGAIWVDCSTVNPSFSLAAATVAEQHEINFVDAPVAGTLPHAEHAELTFFVGGEMAIVNQIKPLLSYMGAKTLHLGEIGKGASFKMLVNMMLAQSMLIFSETVLLGEKMGLDREFLLDNLPNLPVAAPFTKAKSAMIKAKDYEVMFPLEWMHKDLHLASLTAYEVGQPLYLANLAKEVFAAAKAAGLGRLDFAAIHQFLEEK